MLNTMYTVFISYTIKTVYATNIAYKIYNKRNKDINAYAAFNACTPDTAVQGNIFGRNWAVIGCTGF